MALIKNSIIEKLYDYDLCQAIGKIYTDNSYKILNNGTAKGLSPFKNERTPSFSVNSIKNIWKCFGSGIAGVSIIDFIQEYKKVDFLEAVQIACKALNIPIEYENESEGQKQKREQKKSLSDILSKTQKIFRQNFLNLSSEDIAKKYMIERGFTDETLSDFSIGYALPGLYTYFKEQATTTEAEQLGLLKKNDQGMYYDFFKSRIIFPISDKNGHCVGFGGRVLEESQEKKSVKYLNSPESELFNKSSLLYGFHLARKQIQTQQEVYLVEGYTDVMRMHQIGLSNAIATLGTALTEGHLQKLKSICKKIIIFRDSDTAGQNAAQRDLGMILEAGLFADIVALESETKKDPDIIGKLENAIEIIQNARRDAIIYTIEKSYQKAIQKAKEVFGETKKIIFIPEDKKELTDLASALVNKIPDETTKEAYIEQIKELFKIKIKLEKVKKEEPPKRYLKADPDIFQKSEISNDFVNENNNDDEEKYALLDLYQFPDEVCNPYRYKNEILEYGLFQDENQIYCIGDKGNYFISISNFSIEIVQHMQDEQYPMKLIRICNIHGVEKIFDVVSDKINTLSSFKNVVTSFGNFYFSGSTTQHEKLLRFLFDKMGNGRKIDVLGWQPEGFWVWNNKIIIPSEKEEIINKEGLFKFNNESYYIPSANKNYDKNMFKYSPQKKFKSIETTISIAEYFKQMYIVHRQHAITGILFGISSLFQDIVVNNTSFFPILFYFGPASTGKDNICEAIQSLLGTPQKAIQLEGGASTIKAQIREFAQFSNGISQLSEYTRGNAQIDGILKGLWDRRGYKRGSIESKVAVDEIPVLSSTILTGNDYPNAEALITRLIWEEMNSRVFNQQDKEEYNKLKDIIRKGISGLSDFFIHKRAFFQEVFLEKYQQAKYALSEIDSFKKSPSRIMDNLSVLYATFIIFRDEQIFPFNKYDMINHFTKIVENQKRKMDTDSPITKFWDCFLACMRLNQGEVLRVDINLREEGGKLIFNFTNIFSIIQQQWFLQYREPAPAKSEIRKLLKESDAFLEEERNIRINLSINSSTSAFVIDISKLYIVKELLAEIEVQRRKRKIEDVQNEKNEQNEEDSII